jgi:LPPG:FO 2-phospho-L-lactate transferase
LGNKNPLMLKVSALAGGVGGAKLADGLARCLPPENLTVIVNTGDDFEHLGLYICPDLDTVCYTLAGLGNPITGWGRANESFSALETISELGGPGWFRLGDRDLGLHLERTRRLRRGESLTQVTGLVCQAWGILSRVLPMSDDSAPTSVYTIEQGELSFQEYFVHRQCHPQVTGFRFNNIEYARPAPGVVEALESADLVVICPSNPWVSVAPILAVPGIRAALQGKQVVAVSPIIGGQAVKGPAAKMYAELGIEPSALAVARHYGDLLAGFVLDEMDREQAGELLAANIQPLVADILMKTPADRQRLAQQVIEFGIKLEKKSPQR